MEEEVNDKDDVDDGAGVGAGVVALWRTTVGPCRECRADQDESYNKHLQDLTMVFFFLFFFFSLFNILPTKKQVVVTDSEFAFTSQITGLNVLTVRGS